MRKVLITATLVYSFLSAKSQSKNFIDQPYIEVNGSADTLIVPDEIFIKITISEKDTRDKISVEELETKMVNALKLLSIDTEKDLTMHDLVSNYKYHLLRSKDVIKTKEYTLKVHDAVTAMKVFMQLEDLGIANSSIDHVGRSDLDDMKNQMRSKAIENAKLRATALTKPLGQNPGLAINIIDNENYNYNTVIRGNASLQEVVVTGYGVRKETQELPNIEFEKIKVIANVNVKFILK